MTEDTKPAPAFTITGLRPCPSDPYEAAVWRQQLADAFAKGLRRAVAEGLPAIWVHAMVKEGIREAKNEMDQAFYLRLWLQLRGLS